METDADASNMELHGSRFTIDSGSTRSLKSNSSLAAPGKQSALQRFVTKIKDAETKIRSHSNASTDHSRTSSTSPSDKFDNPYDLGKTVKVKGNLKNHCSLSKLSIVQNLIFETEDIPRPLRIRRSESVTSFQSSVQEFASPNGVWIMRFSSDGDYLACGRNDGQVVVWGKNEPEDTMATTSDTGLMPDTPLPGRKGLERSRQELNHSEDGGLNVECDNDKNLPFLSAPIIVFKGHTQAVTDLSWSSSDLLISASLDGTVRLWHVTTQDCLCVFQHSDCVSSLRFHPAEDNFFVSGSLDGRVRLWDISLRKLLCWNEVPRDAITAVSFTKDGSSVVAGTASGICVFYDFVELKYNTQINVASSKSKSQSHAVKVTGIEIMPSTNLTEEKLLVTIADSKTRLVNVRDKSLYRTYKGVELKYGCSHASFSKNGEYIVVAGDDRHVVVWDTLPHDVNQQYSGMLSAVIHRHIDTARAPGQERFVASDHFTTCALFAPWNSNNCSSSVTDPDNELLGTVLLVSDDHGHVYVYENA